MANAPFILLQSELKVGANLAGAVTVADCVKSFRLAYNRPTVKVPGVMSNPAPIPKLGAPEYEMTVSYLTDDTAATTFWRVLWDKGADATGQLYYEGMLHPGAVGVANPKYSGNFLVAGAGIGGDVGSYVEDSQTFPLTAAPTIATA